MNENHQRIFLFNIKIRCLLINHTTHFIKREKETEREREKGENKKFLFTFFLIHFKIKLNKTFSFLNEKFSRKISLKFLFSVKIHSYQ